MKDILKHRTIRLCYLVREDKFINADRLLLEEKLRDIVDLEVRQVTSLQDPELLPCDLLVVYLGPAERSFFSQWLPKFQHQLEKQAEILIPVLFVSPNAGNIDLGEIFASAVATNWYFDLVSLHELDTLPVRVANLLRIHDHLHELKRYGELLTEMKNSVSRLEARLKQSK